MPAYTSKTPLAAHITRTQPTKQGPSTFAEATSENYGDSKTKTRAKYSEDYKHLGKKI